MEYRKDDKILVIEQDEIPGDPRDWDNMGTMICFHRRYELGDKNEFAYDSFNGWKEVKEWIIKEEGATVILPLRLYDHSGISMSTGARYPYNCPWDSGQVGFIYATKDALKEWTQEHKDKHFPGETDEQIIEKVLEGEVKTYDQYLRGDIYAFVLYTVKTCDLGHEHKEHIDSCCGFYGADWKANGLLEHAGIEDLDDWEEVQ